MCDVCKRTRGLPLKEALDLIGREERRRGVGNRLPCLDKRIAELVGGPRDAAPRARSRAVLQIPQPPAVLAYLETQGPAREWLMGGAARESAGESERESPDESIERDRMLADLPSEADRQVVGLYLDGVPQKEIAARCGVSCSEVRNRLSRARARLRTKYARVA